MPWTLVVRNLTSLDFIGFGLLSPKVNDRLPPAERETLIEVINEHPYEYAREDTGAALLYRRHDGYEVVAITAHLAERLGFVDEASVGLRHFWLVEFDETAQ